MAATTDGAEVRMAWAADATAIASVQVRAWRHGYAGILPQAVLEQADPGAFAAHWNSSLAAPKDARNRVLVAVEAGVVVGFAATGPCDDPDADRVADGAILALHVDPDRTGRGHGSRLLHACVDSLRSDGFSRAVSWLFSEDDLLREFLTGAGWRPDGAHRELAVEAADAGGVRDTAVKQVRLHCALT